ESAAMSEPASKAIPVNSIFLFIEVPLVCVCFGLIEPRLICIVRPISHKLNDFCDCFPVTLFTSARRAPARRAMRSSTPAPPSHGGEGRGNVEVHRPMLALDAVFDQLARGEFTAGFNPLARRVFGGARPESDHTNGRSDPEFSEVPHGFAESHS